MLDIISREKSDFFLLDDGIEKEKRDAAYDFIHSNFFEPTMINLSNAAKLLYQRCTFLLEDQENIIVALGQGGALIGDYLLEYMPAKSIYKVQCHRQWADPANYSFQHNINTYNLLGKRIILIEDVIASGETIALAISAVTKAGGTVIAILSATISGESPLQANHGDYNIIVAVSLESKSYCNDKGSNAHWFPAIYSFRHLFYGEDENPHFYEILADLYFNGFNIRQVLRQISNTVHTR